MMTSTSKIKLNPDFQTIFDLLENSDQNLFITGQAGTGKSTLLKHFRDNSTKKIVILAPTGVAALNVSGQTIHSFFLFPPGITPSGVKYEKKSRKLSKILKKLDLIIIDEISMVRADLLDCIDESLRYYKLNNKPFGGIRMVFFGDLYQLPPVVVGAEEQNLFKTEYQSPYFFSARVMERVKLKTIELTEIFRQNDPKFIDLLNKIRNSSLAHNDLDYLNSRCQMEYFAPDDMYITLTTTNIAADDINKYKLSQIESKSILLSGQVNGNFNRQSFPTAIDLEIKIGSQIMLLNNDPSDRWVNGSMGRINDVVNSQFDQQPILIVRLDNGEIVEVSPFTWRNNQYFFNQETKTMDMETIGSFTQYPIRLAWAVTIHKSQGKTFQHVVVDLGNGAFTYGQTYVAISRCTSFEGLLLRRPVKMRDILIDPRINEYFIIRIKKTDP